MRLTEIALEDVTQRYGYWVTHTGDVLEVDFQDHMGVARKALIDLGLLSDDFAMPYGDENALTGNLGWVGFRVEDLFRNGVATDQQVVNIDIWNPGRMTLAGTQGCVRLLGRLDKLFSVEGCHLGTSRAFGRNHTWMMPEVRKPTAQAAKWLTDHSAKLAEPKFFL